ncbi:MAG: AmmeMemoRadiSam system protein B [Candidatus Omnitrophica bacterium CG1_02_49_10]|nr:MAG: AmmeMemoRadiSam system protein B [Candidatus Omnitrophica bacterium CG1_02_49_10]
MVRGPVVAGSFYPADAEDLKDELRAFCERESPLRKYRAAVMPHAGYIYSGAVAGKTLSRVKLDDVATFLILGPNHTGLGAKFSVFPDGRWLTPLGEVGINSKFKDMILDASSDFEEDEKAHCREHSIEVEIPFIQFIKNKSPFDIVAISISHDSPQSYVRLGRALSEAISGYGKKVFIIASSDMTHYEPRSSASEKDSAAIEKIIGLDVMGLAEVVTKKRISMCGYGPVMTAMACCKRLGAEKAELVAYKTSGDVSGDHESVVGYAGVLIQ